VRLEGLLAQALEANKQLTALAERQQAEIVGLRASLVARDAELERVNAELTVLKRMLFGRSSERARATADSGDDHSGDGDAGGRPAGRTSAKRGPGARAGRRDYSHLPRVEVVWDFPDCGYCCPQCQTPFHRLGDYVTEVLDWVVTVRVAAHCRRRYRRVCSCRVPATVTAPGPPKAIGKGLVSNAFIAHLLTERYVAGRSQNSLVIGLARHGADLSAATLTGTCAATGELLAPLEVAIVARSRGSWHLHADETGWRVFTPREDTPDGKGAVAGPVKWWLWVFLGPDTACFVMDPTRSGTVLARHAGIDQTTGQLVEHPDTGQDVGAGSDAGDDADQAEGPRQLVISSDFYSVYSSAGRKASGLVNLYCWAHVRRYFVRAGDANPDQLAPWTAAWLTRIKNLYLAHEQLSAAWADSLTSGPPSGAAGLEQAATAWDEALGVIDTARTKQMASPGLQAPARKALATLDREWDGLAAHRDYPMIGLDNNPAERALRRPVLTRKNAYGSRTEAAARLAARVWTITATSEMAGLNPITYLTAYLDTCGRAGGKPLAGPDLERFLPWAATPDDLHAWKQPPRPG